ncbi:hypothetical protein V6N13_143188 [Hibiscus sabdariffa]
MSRFVEVQSTEEGTDLGAVLRNGREILLQGFNWDSHKYDWWRNLENKIPDIAKSASHCFSWISAIFPKTFTHSILDMGLSSC